MALRPQTDALRGSLDLLVLTTLSLTPMHGWGISPRIQQTSQGVLEVNQYIGIIINGARNELAR